ncbi:hypothetical protein CPB85DRAFT_1283866 [Mucidula mucida]|nr:hypothetical protein CPB85DRAFT_1283866 [Mucidula mucida]
MDTFGDLPFDILAPILHWCSCALVNRAFNRTALPIIGKTVLYHPATTLNSRPELAQYVKHITETGAVHCGMLYRYPNITRDTVIALSRCKNLQSLTWTDDGSTSSHILFGFLNALHSIPIRNLTIQSNGDLGEDVWSTLKKRTGLHKLSIWCMEGPPRVLQGWSPLLGDTLESLELGRCAGVPTTIIIEVLSGLPLLRHLRLKGVPSPAIPLIATYLPQLESLDTDYVQSYSTRKEKLDHPIPNIRQLTIHTSSIDEMGLDRLWRWILDLVPKAGLETFKLDAYTVSGEAAIPRRFILDLAQVHGRTLRHFEVGEAGMTMTDIECLCTKFAEIESIGCSVLSTDISKIIKSIQPAKNLISLRLQMQWMPAGYGRPTSRAMLFTAEDAEKMMLRDESSVLRVIAIGTVLYSGKWIKNSFGVSFKVTEDDGRRT